MNVLVDLLDKTSSKGRSLRQLWRVLAWLEREGLVAIPDQEELQVRLLVEYGGQECDEQDCDAMFVLTRSDAKYCSDKCRNKAFCRRRAEASA